MRGKRFPPPRGSLRRRLIPARAGKTGPGAGSTRTPWAHPRACGENDLYRSHLIRSRGSSPRVRGKQGRCWEGVGAEGLIPARAGKTSTVAACWPKTEAHPRACGENIHLDQGARLIGGSSPRVRGKLRDKKKGKERRGLIPARAGKTSARCPSPQSPQAHPRACGENLESRSIAPLAIGSSPRVRGKLAAVLDDPARTGLIPARAGKTSWRIVPLMEHEAHPRACGENRLVRTD